jgi:hypothetical protein
MKIDRDILKQTHEIVLTGLVTNYPLSLFTIWLIVDVFDISSAFAIATVSTAIMTVFAYIRVYLVRAHGVKNILSIFKFKRKAA